MANLVGASSFLVSGNFESVNSLNISNIASYNGKNWESFRQEENLRNISLLASTDDSLLLSAMTENQIAIHLHPLQAISDDKQSRNYQILPGWRAMAVSFNGTNHFYLGGSSASRNLSSISNLAYWDGTKLGFISNGTDGDIWALAIFQNDLVLAGNFSSVGNISQCQSIAIWDSWQFHPLDRGIDLGGVVYALAVYKDLLYVGGSFSISFHMISNIASWDGSNWQPLLGYSLDDTVYTLLPLAKPNVLLIGGKFKLAMKNKIDAFGSRSDAVVVMRHLLRFDGSYLKDLSLFEPVCSIISPGEDEIVTATTADITQTTWIVRLRFHDDLNFTSTSNPTPISIKDSTDLICTITIVILSVLIGSTAIFILVLLFFIAKFTCVSNQSEGIDIYDLSEEDRERFFALWQDNRTFDFSPTNDIDEVEGSSNTNNSNTRIEMSESPKHSSIGSKPDTSSNNSKEQHDVSTQKSSPKGQKSSSNSGSNEASKKNLIFKVLLSKNNTGSSSSSNFEDFDFDLQDMTRIKQRAAAKGMWIEGNIINTKVELGHGSYGFAKKKK